MKNLFANNIQNYVGVPVGPGSTVVLTLSQDAVTLVGNVIAEIIYVIPIDATGSFSQSIWFNDELNPSNTFYRVAIKVPGVGTVYSQSVPITGASFNLASFVPGSAGLAAGVVLPVFETNGTPNTDQALLNLVPGAGITITSDGTGDVTIAAPAGGVTSVFTRTGAVVASPGDYAVAQVTGAAPLANPALTGVPTAPTAAPLANSTQLATTAYDDAAVAVETARAEAAEATKSGLIASGTVTLGTTLIASGAKATIVTVSAPGVLATDCVMADFASDPSGIVGWQPSANGMLTIIKFCTSGNVNFLVFNNTGASISPSSNTSPLAGMVLNWRVVR